MKFIFYLFVIFSILLNSSYSKAEKVQNIIINGNVRVSPETIKVYGDFGLNQDIDEIKLNQILNDLYRTDFFEDVKIQFEKGILKLDLIEYPVLNRLILIGETSSRIEKEIKKNLKLKEKSSFIKSELSNDINVIKNIYASLGYNFVELDPKIKRIDNDSIELVIEIKKGDVTRISSIKFIGNKKVRDKRLIDIIASEENKFWKVISKNTRFSQRLVELDIRLLKNYYKSIGFYDVSINSKSAQINEKKNIDLTYIIEAGNRYRFNKITTNVAAVFEKKIFFPLQKEYQKIIGEFYSPFKIKKLLEEIDLLIEKNDLQFVEHNVEEILDGDGIEIKFNIFEGEKKLVERINVLGNNITNEDVIRGELLLDEGDPFTELKLEKSIANIKSRDIFNEVTYEVSDGADDSSKVVDIKVEEKPTGEISAGAGIGTDGGSFAINIVENNWLGEGKSVSFDIEVDKESLGGGISYTDPNYDFLGNSVSYFLRSTDNDKEDQGYENTVVTAGANTGFEQFKDVYTNLGLSASYDNLRTLNTASESLKKQAGSFTDISGSYGFTSDKRNRSFQPTDGYITSFSQTLPIYADKKSLSNRVQGSVYNTFSENVIGAAKFTVETINGLGADNVRLSKRKNLSTKRLRGFKKNKIGPTDGGDHIGGNYVTALNFETNFPNFLPESTKTDVGLFLDFGNVWGVDYDTSIDDSNKIRSSFGGAASWVSPLGPMTFVLSRNITKANTDETEGFKFNLGTTF
jgi:outer membrane protein insertion porin family